MATVVPFKVTLNVPADLKVTATGAFTELRSRLIGRRMAGLSFSACDRPVTNRHKTEITTAVYIFIPINTTPVRKVHIGWR